MGKIFVCLSQTCTHSRDWCIETTTMSITSNQCNHPTLTLCVDEWISISLALSFKHIQSVQKQTAVNLLSLSTHTMYVQLATNWQATSQPYRNILLNHYISDCHSKSNRIEVYIQERNTNSCFFFTKYLLFLMPIFTLLFIFFKLLQVLWANKEELAQTVTFPHIFYNHCGYIRKAAQYAARQLQGCYRIIGTGVV